MQTRCTFCGGRLGMVSHRFNGQRFCSKRCKRLWQEYHMLKVRLMRWLIRLKLVPP